MTTTNIAIVGAGPWGLAALDRLVMTAQKHAGRRFAVTLIDPNEPGPGLHQPGQPDHLLLNTVTGQIDSFSAGHFGELPLRGAMPFAKWLHVVNGTPADAHGFLPRAAFGAYLRYVFNVLYDNAPRNLSLRMVSGVAEQLSLAAGGKVRIALNSGGALTADHAFICTGHGVSTPRAALNAEALPPYPMAHLQQRIEPGSAVGISGTGLVAVDVVATLTEGRGGRFERGPDDTLRYCPSGREPVMLVYSRTGTPFACRPSVSLDLTSAFEPLFCTEAYLARRRRERAGQGLQLEDLLAPLCAEMRVAHLVRSVQQHQGEAAAATCRHSARRLAPHDTEVFCYERLPHGAAPFWPEELLLPPADHRYRSFQDFSSAFTARLAFDVAEAKKGEAASPYKFAVELLRVLRRFIRQAVEFDSMAPAARRRFFEQVAPRIAQLVVGPPVLRGEQWLALMRAGLLRADLGPAPAVSRDHARRLWRAQSSVYDSVYATSLAHIVRGHNVESGLQRDGASLLSAMYRSGLCAATAHCAADDEEHPVLLPRLDRQGHPIDATGLPQKTITVLGVPTEGVTYFNHYLPSPKSRAGAFERIQSVIDALTAEQQQHTETSHSPQAVMA